MRLGLGGGQPASPGLTSAWPRGSPRVVMETRDLAPVLVLEVGQQLAQLVGEVSGGGLDLVLLLRGRRDVPLRVEDVSETLAVLLLHLVILQADEAQGVLHGWLQIILFLLHKLDTVELFYPQLIQFLNFLRKKLDWIPECTCTLKVTGYKDVDFGLNR